MAQVVLSRQVRHDFTRIVEHLEEHAPESSPERISAIIAAIDVLETSPRIGRPVEQGMRELVIGSGHAGYVALYRYVPEEDVVLILAVRAQREAGYRGA